MSSRFSTRACCVVCKFTRPGQVAGLPSPPYPRHEPERNAAWFWIACPQGRVSSCCPVFPGPWRFPIRCLPGKAAEDCRSPRRCGAVPTIEGSSWSQCLRKAKGGAPSERKQLPTLSALPRLRWPSPPFDRSKRCDPRPKPQGLFRTPTPYLVFVTWCNRPA